MSRDVEAILTQLRELLPYVARDAERYRNATELVTKSHELRLAARAIDETLVHPSLASTSKSPVIQVRIGTKAVEALGVRKLPYDFREVTFETAEPGEVYDLRYKKYVTTDTFNPLHTQPVYGQLRYFDLATLGRTLEDGGELTVTQPDSSASE